MVGRNSERLIAGKMNSVLSKLRPGDQLVAVDNGSSDQTLMVMLEVAEEDPRVLVVHIPRTIETRARTRGLCECSCDYVLWLGLNDELLDGGVERIGQAIHSDRFATAFVFSGSVPACLLAHGANSEHPGTTTAIQLAENYLLATARIPLCAIVWRRSELGADPYRFDHGAGDSLVLLLTTLSNPRCVVSSISPVKPGLNLEHDIAPIHTFFKAQVDEAFRSLPPRLQVLKKLVMANTYTLAAIASKRRGDRFSALHFYLAAFFAAPSRVLSRACDWVVSKLLFRAFRPRD
jgi:glycosyltransferase involved in cell wall biosynthesis